VLAFNGETPPGTPSGGYQIDALEAYFTRLGLPMPDIENVVVHGPGNEPGEDITAGPESMDSTGEIMLDVCTVGALAPGAKIVVYFSVFTEQGWADVISTIANDTTHKPTVISCSYGNPEDAHNSAWTRGAIKTTDAAFADADRAQITICCASGDDGSRDQAQDFRAHADFPASSPHVLGVGGTRLVATGSTITSETVWDDGPGSRTGGGVSRLFPVPSWQINAGVPVSVNPPHNPGRGVPDVAAVGDPRTGVLIISVDGKTIYPVGGTSAAAPQWAALIARLNQGLGVPVGFLNPLLYSQLATGVLHDITQGDNGAYAAGPGWDACTGLGSPDGEALLKGLQDL
jgi:kumamolisin